MRPFGTASPPSVAPPARLCWAHVGTCSTCARSCCTPLHQGHFGLAAGFQPCREPFRVDIQGLPGDAQRVRLQGIDRPRPLPVA